MLARGFDANRNPILKPPDNIRERDVVMTLFASVGADFIRDDRPGATSESRNCKRAHRRQQGSAEADLNKRTLANVHQALDAAVTATYGWPADLSKEEILRRLLALNRERAG